LEGFAKERKTGLVLLAPFPSLLPLLFFLSLPSSTSLFPASTTGEEDEELIRSLEIFNDEEDGILFFLLAAICLAF
jgi:hypothetical protein